MLPEEGHVNSEGQRFQRVYATTATLPHAATLGELQGNLMKFANVSSPGEAFSYRAEANYELQFPQLSLAKQIVEVDKAPITPTTSATVKGGQEATFALTVTNAGSSGRQRRRSPRQTARWPHLRRDHLHLR